MSTTPPDLPFGDPTAIQAQNRAAMGKGAVFGCGGCAIVLLGIAGVFSAIIFGVFATIGNSDAVTEVMQRTSQSPIVLEHLGTPLTKGWLISGNLRTDNGSSSADFSIPIQGPKGNGRVQANGYKSASDPWVFNVLEVTIDSTGERINLAHPAEAEP